MSIYTGCLYWLRRELTFWQEIGYIFIYACDIPHTFLVWRFFPDL
jgi:hypothetical protein